MKVHVFDTAIDSDNLGDLIIMDAVNGILTSIFGDAPVVRTPSHRRAKLSDMRAGWGACVSIVGGTNILKSHMLVRGNWKITPVDYIAWRNVILLGVGWQQYGRTPDFLTRLFFRSVLSGQSLHSVRDMHTYEMLRPHVPTVIYTACPSMWGLDEAKCRQVPVRKAKNAIFAVTYYRPAPRQDRALFDLVRRSYDKVFFWPQQERDIAYLKDIGISEVIPIEPDLKAFDNLLKTEDVDFVGARLHGGIRALQRARRALIIPVDNRATEISVSTDLPTVSRDRLDEVEDWIENPRPTRIVLPWDAIRRWKDQFGLAQGRCHKASAAR